MLITLIFGDYWNDGHGMHKEALIEAEDCHEVERVLKNLRENFDPCADYSKSSLTAEEWEFLKDSGYPFERFAKNSPESVEDFTSWDAFFENGYHLNCYFDIDTLIDFVIYFISSRSECEVERYQTYCINTKMGYGLFED